MNCLENDYVRSYNYEEIIGHKRIDMRRFVENSKTLLKQKQAKLKELQQEAQCYTNVGATIPESVQKRIIRLERDIIPDLQSQIRRYGNGR